MAAMSIAIVFAVLVLVTVAWGVRLVPQGEEWVVERLGRFHSILKPGLNIIVPYIDRVAYKQSTKDTILDVPQQEAITRDNAVILANALCFAKVTDPAKAAYGVDNYRLAITSLATTALRSIIGEMDLDEALSSRELIKTKLRDAMEAQTHDWGVTVRSVELQDIQPSASMQAAMEQQAAAERQRKAAVTKATGEKEATILEAQARLEAAKLDANAQVALAESSAEAIRKIKEAIGADTGAMMYLLGEKYIASMGDLARSDNAKTVLLPADIQATVRGILGAKG